jgi:hypothetical protein
VYLHASLVPVVAEADDDEALLLGEDGLVHRPSRVQMRQQVRHLRLSSPRRWRLLCSSRLPLVPEEFGRHGRPMDSFGPYRRDGAEPDTGRRWKVPQQLLVTSDRNGLWASQTQAQVSASCTWPSPIRTCGCGHNTKAMRG